MTKTATEREPWRDYQGNELSIGSVIVDERGDVYEFAGYMWATGDTGAGYSIKYRSHRWRTFTNEKTAVRHFACLVVTDSDAAPWWTALDAICAGGTGARTVDERRKALRSWYAASMTTYRATHPEFADRLRARRREVQQTFGQYRPIV